MTAFPMLVRCFGAQWRGLPETERIRLAGHWAQAQLPSASLLKNSGLCQVETPIWQTSPIIGVTVTLLSVKEDYYGLDDGIIQHLAEGYA